MNALGMTVILGDLWSVCFIKCVLWLWFIENNCGKTKSRTEKLIFENHEKITRCSYRHSGVFLLSNPTNHTIWDNSATILKKKPTKKPSSSVNMQHLVFWFMFTSWANQTTQRKQVTPDKSTIILMPKIQHIIRFTRNFIPANIIVIHHA